MNADAAKPPLLPSRTSAPTPKQALHRLFLTLFLRGRGSRGLNQKSAPTSISKKLFLTLLVYLIIGGATSFGMMIQHIHVFALAVSLHTMTFAFIGLFVASSAGEILFNKEETDILLHRPIEPRTMLWSKIRVIIEVSLWLAGAFNVAGLLVGLGCLDGGWRFPIAHVVSIVLEALFCIGCVVLAYQLCLRWLGRDRLEGLMTTTQVIVSVAVVLSAQILPRIMFRYGQYLTIGETHWWIGFFPPAWFAGFDDAIAGSGAFISWIFTAIAVAATGLVVWLAFDKLAKNYEIGLQTINEIAAQPKQNRRSHRWLDWLVKVPPLRWWLRDPVSRASFLLTTAYLIRDRDTKLRVYPSIAPMLVVPFVFLFQPGRSGFGREFGVAFSGCYLTLIPLMGMSLLHYSQQWQASDIFRSAPTLGPAAICHGARRAVLCFLTLPMLAAMVAVVWLLQGITPRMLLLLPGIIALPISAIVPGLIGRAVPLSAPIEEAKSASRGLSMVLVMFISFALSGLALLCWSQGWFWPFVAVEAVVVIGIYIGMRYALNRVKWQSAE